MGAAVIYTNARDHYRRHPLEFKRTAQDVRYEMSSCPSAAWLMAATQSAHAGWFQSGTDRRRT
jgi:hypothetical protein